ncbi:MAG: hypothetical protein H7Z13_04785 [Ferruginibacter sp.]|nr:hypothetical protein [Ferruginibacter sp.]
MYQIIASTLFQNKICRLPGIGTLTMVAHSAETDFVNALIKPPAETIDFIAEVNAERGFNEFSAMSELLQKNLDEKGSFLLKGIGAFTKDHTGKIQFVPTPIDSIFTPVVAAERVVRQDASHPILVGDQQTTNMEMSNYFMEKQPLKDQWRIWAILLAAIGIGALLFYFYQHGFNGFGNVR